MRTPVRVAPQTVSFLVGIPLPLLCDVLAVQLTPMWHKITHDVEPCATLGATCAGHQWLFSRPFILCPDVYVVHVAGDAASTTMFYTAAAIVGVVPPLNEPERAQVTRKAAQVGTVGENFTVEAL